MIGLGCMGGQCRPLGGELERCSSPLECAPELYCRYPYADGSCRPRVGEGETCSDGECAAGFSCVARACRRTSGPGEVCEGQCPPTFGCDADGRCVELPLPGDACDAELSCGNGDCVDGTCQLGQEGDRCGGDLDCAGYCDVDLVFGSECVGPRVRGEACEDSSICDGDLVCRTGACDDPCPRSR